LSCCSNDRDIVKLFPLLRETGGTRRFGRRVRVLNGQSQSDDILIDVRRHWNGGKVEDDGRRVRARPGMILGHINSLLVAARSPAGTGFPLACMRARSEA